MRDTLAIILRTRGCPTLLIGNFLITLGSSMVLPYLAIYLTEHEGISPWVVGVALTLRVWSQYGLMLAGGAVSDRIGPVHTMCLGVVVRALSYLILAVSSSGFWVIAACGLMGLGSSFYIPAGKSALTGLVGDPARMPAVFSVRSAVNNTGLAVGPLIGALLLIDNPHVGLAVTALVFLALLPALWPVRRQTVLLGEERERTERVRPRRGMRATLRNNPRLWWVLACAVAFGFCYIQIEYALPTMASRHHGPAFAGLLFTVNAVCVVVLQVLISVPLSRFVRPAPIVAGGLLTMGLGFGVMSTGAAAPLVVGMVLFSLGEVIVDPRLDSEVTAVVDVENRGIAFGLVGICIATGGAMANVAASLLAGEQRLGDGYWVLLLGIATLLSVTMLVSFPRRRGTQVDDTAPLPTSS